MWDLESQGHYEHGQASKPAKAAEALATLFPLIRLDWSENKGHPIKKGPLSNEPNEPYEAT